MKLIDRSQQFIDSGGDQFRLIEDCVLASSQEALFAIQMMAEDMYGGFTYNLEPKAAAAFCLPIWGEAGLDALVEMAIRTATSKNQSLAVEILATLAAGRSLPQLETWIGRPELAEAVRRKLPDNLAQVASARLRSYLLAFEDDDDAASVVGFKLFTSQWFGGGLASVLFQAMSSRWLALSDPVLDQFTSLIEDRPNHEPAFQEFLERHPQLLDPMAVEVWARPSIHGAREPDFLLRRSDDSFLVVEIECPGKLLMTSANQLSAEATHAIGQANGYREFLSERLPTIRGYISGFRAPDCMVVIGLERGLSDDQRRSLATDNDSRSHLRIVGFDWLIERARTVNSNVVEKPPPTALRIRIV